MHCPEYIVTNNRFIFLTMHYHADVPRRYVAKTAWINPLRYSCSLFYRGDGEWLIKINTDGKAHRIVSDFIFRIKVKLGLRVF